MKGLLLSLPFAFVFCIFWNCSEWNLLIFVLVYNCSNILILKFVFGSQYFLLAFQASPILINGRHVVVEEKRSTNRGKSFLLFNLGPIHV